MTNPFSQHGAFSWFELMTTAHDDAKAFYREMFGWELDDQPMPTMPDTPYTVVKVAEQEAAGIMPLLPNMQGVPPHWALYITVNDVDASAKQVETLGGKVLMTPTDIPDVGRFAVIQDPQGATLNIMTYQMPAASGDI
ncbi:MAG: VOC family protein [Cyanobacteria bacterium J06659_2]